MAVFFQILPFDLGEYFKEASFQVGISAVVAGSVQGAVSGRVVGGSGSRAPGFASMAIDASILNTCGARGKLKLNIQGDQKPEDFDKPEFLSFLCRW